MTLYQLFSYLLIEPFNPYYPTLHHTSKVLFYIKTLQTPAIYLILLTGSITSPNVIIALNRQIYWKRDSSETMISRSLIISQSSSRWRIVPQRSGVEGVNHCSPS